MHALLIAARTLETNFTQTQSVAFAAGIGCVILAAYQWAQTIGSKPSETKPVKPPPHVPAPRPAPLPVDESLTEDDVITIEAPKKHRRPDDPAPAGFEDHLTALVNETDGASAEFILRCMLAGETTVVGIGRKYKEALIAQTEDGKADWSHAKETTASKTSSPRSTRRKAGK